MQLLPNPEQSRPLAIGLAVVALVIVYLAGFHWFVLKHVDMGREIDRLERQISRFKATAAERPRLEARLEDLRLDRLDSALFLQEPSFNIAAAALTRRLRDIISTQAEDTELCQVSATQNQPAREPERFEQVKVNVRMQCPLEDFVRVLYELENSVPLVFVDNLIVNQRAMPDRRRRGTTYGLLDIRFDMYGYLAEARNEA